MRLKARRLDSWNLFSKSYCFAMIKGDMFHHSLMMKRLIQSVVDCPTQLTLVTWICQLSRRWDPSKGGSKMFGASLRPGKDIWRRFLCKIYMVCPYKLVTCKQNASKKVQNLLKTAVSAGRQSHPPNGEQACSKSHMDFSGSDLHISH